MICQISVWSLLARFNKDFAMKFLPMLGLLGFYMCAVAIRNKGSWDKGDEDASISTLSKYKASLTKDQKVFVKECHQADEVLPSYVSCGHTVSCFVELFSKDPSFTAGKYNLEEEHIEKALGKVRFLTKSVILQDLVDKFFARSKRSVFELFGNSAINQAFVSLEDYGGRDFAVDLALASFEDLVHELMKEDKDGAWEDVEGPNGPTAQRFECSILETKSEHAGAGLGAHRCLCV